MTGAHSSAEWRTLRAVLGQVERLVLVLRLVRLLREDAEVVERALSRDQRQQRAVGDAVVGEGVEFLPAPVQLGGVVLVVEDQTALGAGPPLYGAERRVR